MKGLKTTALVAILTFSICSAASAGTITGSRTNATISKTGTITGSRTDTATESRTGTITGSRTDSTTQATEDISSSALRTDLFAYAIEVMFSFAW